jgi:hypothetical protein
VKLSFREILTILAAWDAERQAAKPAMIIIARYSTNRPIHLPISKSDPHATTNIAVLAVIARRLWLLGIHAYR